MKKPGLNGINNIKQNLAKKRYNLDLQKEPYVHDALIDKIFFSLLFLFTKKYTLIINCVIS